MNELQRLSPDQRWEVYQHALRSDFLTFVRAVFRELNPSSEFVESWAVEAVAHAVMQVVDGARQRLVVNLPPRSLKTIIVSIALPAFVLGRDPTQRIVCISYSEDLAETFTRSFRRIITAPWYRQAFPALQIVKATDREIVTSRGGGRFATSVGGSLTGRGGNLFIIDDPIKPKDALSEARRREVNEWLGHTLASRLDDQQRDKMIMVMQRVHVDDPSGVVLTSGRWEHLSLPAIADIDRDIPLGFGRVKHWRAGELLDPRRFPLDVLDSLKKDMGERAFAGQYLQQPHPPDGSIFKRSWFRSAGGDDYPYEEREAFTVQSWDAAISDGEHANWSVCTTWLIYGDDYYLVDIDRVQLELPALVQRAKQLAKDYVPRHVLVEENGIGKALIQYLEAEGLPVEACNSRLDKVARAHAASVPVECGHVYLPAKETASVAGFIAELLAFPTGRHDDQVDSMAQCINWWEERRNSPLPTLIIGSY